MTGHTDSAAANIAASHLAEVWTSGMMIVIQDEQSEPSAWRLPDSPSPLVDLTDVGSEVFRYGAQLRSLAAAQFDVPVLVERSSNLTVLVDLAPTDGSEGDTAGTDVGRWIGEARVMVGKLAHAPGFIYDEVPMDSVIDVLHLQTRAFVTSRIVASWIGGATRTTMYPVTVHTSASGLRVHWSLNITWNPVFFGAPSPSVTGSLPAGRYQFGVDGSAVSMKQDLAVFDIPQTTDAYLTVA